MDDRRPNDRTALFELLLFVPCSFLAAWFFAGFSLSQFWHIVTLIAALFLFAGEFVASILAAALAGACFVWLAVRLVNRRSVKLPPDTP